MKKALLPCFLACLTTVLGLFSLTVSRVIPIKNFGLYSTAALIIGSAFFFVYIGSFIEERPIQAWRTPRNEKTAAFFSIERLWGWLPEFVWKYRVLVATLSFALLFGTAYCLPWLQTTVTFHGMFPKNAPVILDYEYLEDRFGGLVPLEVIVSVPKAKESVNQSEGEKEMTVDWLSQVRLLEKIDAAVKTEMENVESSLSALNFLPEVPETDGTGLAASVRRSVFNKMIDARMDILTREALFDGSLNEKDREMNFPESNRWRLSVRVRSDKGIQYGSLIHQIDQVVSTVIAEEKENLHLSGTTAVITGGIPLAHKTQKQLLDDLSSSYISAFFLILLTLALLLRGVWPGTIAMIPNIFPSVVVFGLMAFFGIPVDMGVMMTASVALGISVDGTIHFLTWYKQGLATGKSQPDSVRFAYRECGTAMVQATLICGGGMLVFAFSSLLPISRFAWVMAVLLTIALYGDLVLFPSLLYGPLGRCFYPKRRVIDQKSAE